MSDTTEKPEKGKELSWEEVEEVHKAFGAIHVKGVDALITCAENMVKLEPTVKAYKIAKENVFGGKVGPGQNMIRNDHPRFAEVVEELDGLRKKTAVIVGLVPIKKEDLEVQNAAPGAQQQIAILASHGLLQLSKR